jgi:hypothetical protein
MNWVPNDPPMRWKYGGVRSDIELMCEDGDYHTLGHYPGKCWLLVGEYAAEGIPFPHDISEAEAVTAAEVAIRMARRP